MFKGQGGERRRARGSRGIAEWKECSQKDYKHRAQVHKKMGFIHVADIEALVLV